MKILVAVKRVMDYKTSIRLKADGSGVETAHAKMIMNPFDEIAVEEAIRLKEKGVATEVTAVSMGGEACQEILRTALAMGADRALLIKTESELQPLAVAKVLQALAQRENPQLILLGKQAIDTDHNQVGQMLAGLLNWAQGTFASQVDFHDSHLRVTREVDGGLTTLLLTLPAVITTDLRLNEPRYLSLPNIVQAKRKTITQIPVEELAVDIKPRTHLLQVTIPVKRRSGIRVTTAADLVHRLKHEAQVI